MPITVPTPEPEVNYQPTPMPRESATASPETFGYAPGVNQAIDQFGLKAGQLAVYAKIQADNTRVDDATAKLSQVSENLLRNPKTGFLTQQGENAWKPNDKGISPHQQTQDEFRKSVNTIGAELSNPDQKALFSKVADTYYNDFNKLSDAHLFQQQKEYEKTTVNAVLSTQQNRAAAGYSDGQVIDDSIATQKRAIQHFAESNGMGQDWVKQEYLKAESSTHAGVVERMLGDQQDLMAEKYYDITKETIDAKTRDQLDKMLETASLRGGAARAADQILKDSPDSEEDALKSAEKIKDARVQDATEQLISRHFTMLRQAKKNDQEELFTNLGQQVDKHGLTDPVDIRESIPIPQWEKLTEPQRKAIMNRASNDPTSPRKWMDFMQEVKDKKLEGMTRAELETNYLPHFDLADKKRAMDMWGEIHKGGSKAAADMNSQKALEVSMINSGLMKAESKNRKEPEMKLYYNFDGDLHQSYLEFQATNGRIPKAEEIQKMIDEKIINYRSEQKATPHFWSPKYVVVDDAKRGAIIPFQSIPQDEREALQDVGRSRGVKITNEKMERLFAAVQQKDVKRYKQILSE